MVFNGLIEEFCLHNVPHKILNNYFIKAWEMHSKSKECIWSLKNSGLIKFCASGPAHCFPPCMFPQLIRQFVCTFFLKASFFSRKHKKAHNTEERAYMSVRWISKQQMCSPVQNLTNFLPECDICLLIIIILCVFTQLFSVWFRNLWNLCG